MVPDELDEFFRIKALREKVEQLIHDIRAVPPAERTSGMTVLLAHMEHALAEYNSTILSGG